MNQEIDQPTAYYTFQPSTVKVLSKDDFDYKSKFPIGLKFIDPCIIVLFYDSRNIESIQLAQLFYVASKQIPSLYAGLDFSVNPEIAQAFIAIGASNSLYKPFGLKQIPYILVYRDGWPTAYYNGERSVQALVDWTMTLACNRDYFEPIQLFGSISVKPELRYEISGVNQFKPRTQSIEYKTGDPVREYDSRLRPVVAGTPAATAEARIAQTEEQRSGVRTPGRVESAGTTLGTGAATGGTGGTSGLGGAPVNIPNV